MGTAAVAGGTAVVVSGTLAERCLTAYKQDGPDGPIQHCDGVGMGPNREHMLNIDIQYIHTYIYIYISKDLCSYIPAFLGP
jgi:hypothetical protein